MPTVSAPDLTRLRTTRHATLLTLSVYHPASIWTGRVNGLQITGDTTITVDGVAQTVAPRKNYLVKIGSTSGGSEYGTARFISYSAPTLTVGVHNCSLPDDAYVTIAEEIKPTAIHFAISASDVVTEDGNIAYTNENVQYMPLARIGCPAVAYIDPATGLATVNFYSSSVAFGGALSTYAWVFPSGTPATSATAGTSGAPVAVTWNTAGEYYVRLTVTDANGKTHTRYTPVFIYDTSNSPYRKIEVSGLSGDADGGTWQCSIKVMESTADTTAFPEQALCVLSAEDWYGTEKVSIGGHYTHRENIVFVGYIRRGTVTKNPFTGYVEFELESVSGVMDNIWELAHTLENTAGTPSGWHQLQNMTFNLAAHHILTQHSTISEIADCNLNLPTYARNFVDANDTSLKSQLNEGCCTPARSRIGCSRQGMLYLEANPQLLAAADRTHTNIIQTTFADLREIDFGDEQQEKQTSQVDFAGENASDDPVFSLAPATPWQTGQSEKVDGIRVASQSESNILSGLFEGYRNNSFADVVVSWRGNYRVFDVFPVESIQASIAANQNARGIVWSNQKCWLKSVSMDYAPGILTVTTTIEKDVIGTPGVTGNYPIVPPDEPPPSYPPVEPPIVPPPEPPPVVPPGDGSRAYVATDQGVAISSDFLTSATWTALNGGLSGDGLDVYEFKFDPWSSNGTTLATGFIVCKNGVWKNTGLPAGSWTQVLTSAAVQTLTSNAGTVNWGRGLILPMNTQNFIGIWVNQDFGGAYRYYWLYSTDGGTIWNANTTNTIDSNHKPKTQGYAKDFDAWPSHKTAGTLYAIMATGTGGGGELDRYYKTTNNGVTWTKILNLKPTASGISDYGQSLPKGNVMPFANGSGTPYADDLRCWGIHNASEIRYTTAFPGYVVYNTDDWTLSLASGTTLTFLDMCTWDEDYIYACSAPAGVGADGKVHYTNNGGTSWANHAWAIANSKPYCLSALPYNALFCTVAGPACIADGSSSVGIELTLDGGPSWTDHTGDLKTVLSGIRGIRSIVPDWIKVT